MSVAVIVAVKVRTSASSSGGIGLLLWVGGVVVICGVNVGA